MDIGDIWGAAHLIIEIFKPKINRSIFMDIIEYLDRRIVPLGDWAKGAMLGKYDSVMSAYKSKDPERIAIYKKELEEYLKTEGSKNLQRILEEIKEMLFSGNSPNDLILQHLKKAYNEEFEELE
jgi:hypothetical protein